MNECLFIFLVPCFSSLEVANVTFAKNKFQKKTPDIHHACDVISWSLTR